MTEGFDDAYATCARTYAIVLIIREDLNPEAVTEQLRIVPTVTVLKDQSRRGSRFKATTGLWQLSSREQVESRDVRRHIVWLLDGLRGRECEFQRLRAEGYQTVMSCYWLSAQGQGGPMLGPLLMRRLSDFGMELWFDIYGPVE